MRNSSGAPPQIRGIPLLGCTLSVARDILGFSARAKAEHGDVVEFRMFGGRRVLQLTSPDDIEAVLVGQRDAFIKDWFTRDLSQVLGQGLLVSEGEPWRKHRRLAQPAFHRRRISAYGEAMVACATRGAERFEDGRLTDVHARMMELTLEIVAETLLVSDVGDLSVTVGHALEHVMDRFAGVGAFLPLAVPTPTNLRARRAIATLDSIVYGLIRDRRAGGDRGDLLSMLIAAAAEEGSAIEDAQLRDETMTMLLAGHETTALALGFALWLLAGHPDAQDALSAEIDAVVGARAATVADLPRLRFADAVVREAMRLYPPAWVIGREATRAVEIGGARVEPGTQVWLPQWVVHRDARWYASPDEFQPERWLAEGFVKALPRYAFFPFGGGPRMCIGNTFAMTEAVLVLVTLVQRLRFERAAGAGALALALAPSVTLRPKHGIHLRVSRRR